MKYKYTNRPGFLLGFIDFFTAGLFFLIYMPLGGLQNELDEILGKRTHRFFDTLNRIEKELNNRNKERG